MGLFSSIKKLFKKDSFPLSPEGEAGLNSSVNQPQPEERNFKEDKCGVCGDVIGGEKYRKVGGHFIHKKCFKSSVKSIRNGQQF